MDVTLAAVESLIALIGGQSVPIFTRAPTNQAYPYMVLGHMVIDQSDLFKTRISKFDATVTVFSDYRGPKEVLDIMSAVFELVHETKLSLATGDAAICIVTRRVTALDQDGLTETGNIEISLTLQH